MTVWGRILAALRRTDPARLLAVAQAELARAGRLTGGAAERVLDRAIADFQRADHAGAGAEAALGLAQALRAKAVLCQPAGADPASLRMLRARGVAVLKTRVAARGLSGDPLLHHRLLSTLAEAWSPLPGDDPVAPATLPLLVQARDAQSAAAAALNPETAPDVWREALFALAGRELALAAHPACPDDAAAEARDAAARTLRHLSVAAQADPRLKARAAELLAQL